MLDGETFKVRTRAADLTRAEVQVSADKGGAVTDRPMALRFRMLFVAFGRNYPDHELGQNYGRFIEALDDVTEEADLAGVSPMDPTPPADSDA